MDIKIEQPQFVKCEPAWSDCSSPEPDHPQDQDKETCNAPPKSEDDVFSVEDSDPCASGMLQPKLEDPSSFVQVQMEEAVLESNESAVNGVDTLNISKKSTNSGGTNCRRKKYPCACTICGKILKNSNSHHYHMFVHSTDRKFVCQTCGKGFKGSGALRNHQGCHSDETAYKCNICGFGFKRLAHLQHHQLLHTEGNPHKCETCGKAFKTPEYLKRHSRVHTNTSVYVCQTCNKSFKRRSDLKGHMKIHNPLTCHTCLVCGKAFSRVKDFKRHSLTHRDNIPSLH